MQAMSARFRSEIARSHEVATRVDIYDRQGRLVGDFPVLSGSIDGDRRANIARRCSLTILDEDRVLSPSMPSDVLAPFGSEMRPYRGIRFSDGTTELIPLGVFAFDVVAISDTDDGDVIQISGFDRSLRIARARFSDVYVIAYGADIATAIATIIASISPTVTFVDKSVTARTAGAPIVFSAQDDPWQRCGELAETLGCFLLFDATGVLTLAPEPTDAGGPVWVYTDDETSMVLSVNREWSTESTYTRVVVTGENTGVIAGAVPRGIADESTLSMIDPTTGQHYLGVRPFFFSSSFVTSQSHAEAVAAALLARHRGSWESIKFESLVNPAHELGDVITIDRGAVSANYVIEGFRIPLDVDSSMTVTTRKYQP